MKLNFSFLRIGSKGQMFEGYEIIMGVIMGLLMAVIIMSAINYFSGAQQEISHKQLNEGFVNALQNVLDYDNIKLVCTSDTIEDKQKCISKLVVEKGLKLDPAVYTGKSLSVAFPEIKEECIQFTAPENSTYAGTSMSILKINKFVKTDVYFACFTNSGALSIADCPIVCKISISEMPDFTS